jgi:hypothetical protein
MGAGDLSEEYFIHFIHGARPVGSRPSQTGTCSTSRLTEEGEVGKGKRKGEIDRKY